MARARSIDRRHERGTALIELALVLPILLTIVLFTAELGLLIKDRLIVTNVSREGGSLGSRLTTIDNRFLNLMYAAAKPIDLTGNDGRVYVTRITSGVTEADPRPHVTTTLTGGRLGTPSMVDPNATALGLPRTIYDRLTFQPGNGTADIAEITVVEVYYKHRPVTPLQRFMRGLVLSDGDGTILRSKAIF
jgi:Flp pilus assembly protein TadG